ncbi:MAG: sugar translocase [Parcubacteria group bacterium]|nr:sugar translocase [Parcubacteria group bacterium]
MKLEVVVPAYNEAEIIEESVRAIQEALSGFPLETRITVADNGSTDETSKRAARAGAHLLAVPTRGKGAALAYAASKSDAEFFAFIDADLSAPPNELVNLYHELETHQADIVIGSRLLATADVHRSFLRTCTSKLFNALRKVLLGISVVDTQCGLKLMNEKGRHVLASCEETGWFLDIELLAKAERAGLVIREVPVAWEEFRFAGRESKLRVLRDGIGAVFAMLRIRSRLA